MDFKFGKVEESIKDAVATLEREVIDCFKRRDKNWAKQLDQTKDPEAAISTATATTSPVSPTSTPGFPPANHPSTSTTSRTTNRATDGEFCATTPTGPDFDHIFSILPFSREQLSSAQGDDGTLQGLSISPSTPLTNRIEVREHQGLLYRRIQKGDDIYKIQLVVPKTLTFWSLTKGWMVELPLRTFPSRSSLYWIITLFGLYIQWWTLITFTLGLTAGWNS